MSDVQCDTEFSIESFRKLFPAFADTTRYPDTYIALYYEETLCFLQDGGCWGMLSGCCTTLARYMLIAHFIYLAANAARGKQGGFKTSASVDRVSVSYLAPPAQNMFSWWLGQSPYGQQLAALLELKGVGGTYIGGLPERTGFRKVGGTFW